MLITVLLKVSLPDLFVALTWTSCHTKVALNSVFFFFVSRECREEMKKTLCSLCPFVSKEK